MVLNMTITCTVTTLLWQREAIFMEGRGRSSWKFRKFYSLIISIMILNNQKSSPTIADNWVRTPHRREKSPVCFQLHHGVQVFIGTIIIEHLYLSNTAQLPSRSGRSELLLRKVSSWHHCTHFFKNHHCPWHSSPHHIQEMWNISCWRPTNSGRDGTLTSISSTSPDK